MLKRARVERIKTEKLCHLIKRRPSLIVASDMEVSERDSKAAVGVEMTGFEGAGGMKFFFEDEILLFGEKNSSFVALLSRMMVIVLLSMFSLQKAHRQNVFASQVRSSSCTCTHEPGRSRARDDRDVVFRVRS